jgi:hypothetical protein
MAAPAAREITEFHDRMTDDQAMAWFTNAQNRLLQWKIAAGDNIQISTLIQLIGVVLPKIILKSYYKKGEFAEWNMANTRNHQTIDELTTQMVSLGKELQKKENIVKGLETLGKPIPSTLRDEIRTLRSRISEIESSLLGANGPMFRIQTRKESRRRTLRNRQDSYIVLLKAFLDTSDLFTAKQKTEAKLFIDGLIPYFKKFATKVGVDGNVRYTLMESNNDYHTAVRDFTTEFNKLPTTGSKELREGLERLTAETRAAAAAVAHIPGMEGFNSLTNDILFNPESQNKNVIEMLNIVTPDMMRRLEQRIEDKVKLESLERRLAALRTLPTAGTKAYTTLEDLISRLEALRRTGNSGRKGGARRKTRRTTRRFRR